MAGSPFAFYDGSCSTSGPSSSSCGVRGYDMNLPVAFDFTKDPASASLDGCAAFCRARSTCVSFAYANDSCYAYSEAVPANFNADETAPNLFYDLSCVAAPSS